MCLLEVLVPNLGASLATSLIEGQRCLSAGAEITRTHFASAVPSTSLANMGNAVHSRAAKYAPYIVLEHIILHVIQYSPRKAVPAGAAHKRRVSREMT